MKKKNEYNLITKNVPGPSLSQLQLQVLIKHFTNNTFQFSLVLGIFTVVIGCVGLAGNIVSICVLLSPDMKNCFNHLLVTLNISDRYSFQLCKLFPDLFSAVTQCLPSWRQNYIEQSLPSELFSKALPYCFNVQLCRKNITVRFIGNIGPISFIH